jgi:hypothetical protein
MNRNYKKMLRDGRFMCFLSNRTSIKRCHHPVRGKSLICNSHLCKKMCNFKTPITLYNGCVCVFTDKKTITDVLNKPVYLYKKYNIDFVNYKFDQNKIDKQCKLIKSGTSNQTVNSILRENILKLKTRQSVINFFNESKSKKTESKKLINNGLARARYFIGVFWYFKRHPDKIINIQRLYRKRKKDRFYKEKYKNDLQIIKNIQIFYKYKLNKRKCPVKPLRMKFFREKKSLSKIKFIQTNFKKFIKYKKEHSHDCPYSIESYIDIPSKYRICYKYTEGKNTHWRYYNIKWLHNDWNSQTNNKRFVVEPVTKKEFDEKFVEKVAKKVWILSRIERDYSLEKDEKSEYKYSKHIDWDNTQKRRAFYSFVMLFYDFCYIVDIDINNVKNLSGLRNEKNKRIFFYFALEMIQLLHKTLLLFGIAHYKSYTERAWNIISSPYNNLLQTEQEKNSDIVCSLSIFTIYRLLEDLKSSGIKVGSETFFNAIIKKEVKKYFQSFFINKNYKKYFNSFS